MQNINYYKGKEETIFSMKEKIEQHKLINSMIKESKRIDNEIANVKKQLTERGLSLD